MHRRLIITSLCSAVAVAAFAQNKADTRVVESATVLNTIMAKNEIPKNILDRAVCVMVYPSVRKVGVGLGVTYGRGVLICRTGNNFNGKWGPPIMYTLDVGSLGPQLGTSSTDYVGLVMTERGANKVLSGRLKLGAGAQAVAGPSGAQASGFNDPNVDILTYAQSKGLFAGAAIGGASMSSDDPANRLLYGKAIDAPTFARDPNEPVPDAAKRLDEILQRATPRHVSS